MRFRGAAISRSNNQSLLDTEKDPVIGISKTPFEVAGKE
jgi:hypothetical protein